MLINVEMPTLVGILTFSSKINFMLSWIAWKIVLKPWGMARGYKTFSMLNSAEHEIDPAYKC